MNPETKYNMFKESKEFCELLSVIESIKMLGSLEHEKMYNLGYEAAYYFKKLLNLSDSKHPITHPIAPPDLKMIQNKLSSLLKCITNFQSGFNKGFERAQEEEIATKYYARDE